MSRSNLLRPSLDETFMRSARLWALRSTCQHLNVGAVLARDGRTLATGYNGAPPGLQHCQHDAEDRYTRCQNTVHAEGNVLAYAAKDGVSTAGSTLYCTHSPCRFCAGLLISAGIVRVVFENMYVTDGLGDAGIAWFEEAGVQVDLIGNAARV